MAAEKVGGAEGGASSSERGRSGGEEMNGNSSSGKGVMVVGGGGGGAAYHRWNNGDAVPLKRRRVGLSNGGSVSDGGGSTDEEEEEEEDEREDEEEDDDVGEDAEEVAPEELSDDYEDRTIVGGAEAVEEEEEEEDEEEEEEEEEAEARVEAEVEEEEIEDEPEEEEVEEANEANEEEEDDEQHLIASSAMDHRGGSTSSRGREPPIEFDEHDDVGTDDEGYEEEHAVSDSPPVARARGREREREIEMSFPEDVGGRDSSDDSDEERVALPLSRKIIDRGQSSASEGHHHHREIAVVPQKPARGLMDTAKRKAVPEFVAPRNGSGEPKQQQQPKKPRAPAAPRRKANGEGTTVPKARTRFSTDNKARVTLERAREILATVKAAMLKQNSKQFTVRHPEPRIAVENSSSSEDERKIMPIQHQQQSRAIHQQQVKVEEKVVKKRSRAAPTKAGKEPTPRRRKPKVEVEYHHATEEKSFYRGKPQQVDGSNHDHHAFKLGHFPTSGAEASRMEMDDHHNNGYSGEDGYEQQQITVVEKKARKRRKTKEAEDVSATGLCPGSVIRDENWVPPQSPYGLIQESLYKDPWKVLLSCMLLNKTAGRQFLVQMHKVIWDLFSLCPDAETAINMDTAKIAEKVYSLGLQNKRAKMIQRFSLEYLRGDWTNVTQLHGIGKYAADAYAIFCQGLWREVEPDDLMLNKYWKWLWETNGLGADFTPEAL